MLSDHVVERTVDAGGVRWHVVECGDREAPPLLLLQHPAVKALRGDLGVAHRALAGREVIHAVARGLGQDHVRITDIDGDVAPVRQFLAQRGDKCAGICKGLAEDEPAPAAIEREILLHRLLAALMAFDGRLETLFAQAFEPVLSSLPACPALLSLRPAHSACS